MCVDENSGRRVLDPKTIPLDISTKRIDKVGRYALTLAFSDGHSTGIYTYKSLRKLCECEKCAKEKGTFQETFSV
jgi:ATP-binding protein involved in chromosome partitioning